MAGRKSQYTPEVCGELLNALRGGSTIKDACAYAGISEDTYARWQKQHTDFADTVKKARADARIQSVLRIRKAGAAGEWQADAWYLERSDPESWARRTYAKIEGLDELLALSKARGINVSDIFAAMIAELAHADADGG